MKNKARGRLNKLTNTVEELIEMAVSDQCFLKRHKANIVLNKLAEIKKAEQVAKEYWEDPDFIKERQAEETEKEIIDRFDTENAERAYFRWIAQLFPFELTSLKHADQQNMFNCNFYFGQTVLTGRQSL